MIGNTSSEISPPFWTRDKAMHQHISWSSMTNDKAAMQQEYAEQVSSIKNDTSEIKDWRTVRNRVTRLRGESPIAHWKLSSLGHCPGFLGDFLQDIYLLVEDETFLHRLLRIKGCAVRNLLMESSSLESGKERIWVWQGMQRKAERNAVDSSSNINYWLSCTDPTHLWAMRS